MPQGEAGEGQDQHEAVRHEFPGLRQPKSKEDEQDGDLQNIGDIGRLVRMMPPRTGTRRRQNWPT